jgi:hypothetical protein
MDVAMKVLNLVGGDHLAEENDGPASRMRWILLALAGTAGFAALYGLAAGSTDWTMALANTAKMPMVIVLSALSAMPAALLLWKLGGSRGRATDLLMGLASGNLTASVVLAVLAPVVALYYHTSDWLGGWVALGAASLALLVGVATGAKAIWTRFAAAGGPEAGNDRFVNALLALVPTAAMVTMQMVVMLQLIAVASPILPETTVFDGGADAIVRGGGQ